MIVVGSEGIGHTSRGTPLDFADSAIRRSMTTLLLGMVLEFDD